MNFTKKTIKSNYLGEEFEVSCWEMTKGGKTTTIVEHAAIEDITFNKLEKLEGFKYFIEPITGFPHPVARCVMSDNSGREIVAIGEAHPDTLVNKISRQNPVIMAANRAFDRAAIRFLNFEGKVYSSEEIQEDDSSSEGNGVVSDAQSDIVDDKMISDAQPDVIDDAVVSDQNTEIVDQDANKKEVGTYTPGAVTINFGKYRGKNKTVAEIWSTDPSWADYGTKMNQDSCGETTKKQIQALKDYKKQVQ